MPAAHHRDALATPFDGQRGRSRRIACLTLQTLRLTASYPPFRLDSVSRAARSYFRRSVRGSGISSRSLVSVEDVAYQIYGLRIPAFKRSPARFAFLPDEGRAFFQQCCVGRAPRDHVLLSESGKVWRRQHAGPFRLAAARAGLPSTFVFHGLRHTYASDLICHGVPLEVVARQLGHADTRTVASTYGHLAERYREEMIRSRFSALVTDPVEGRSIG
ncbi:tyrosine-type recombinase/integrase [Limimaricola litoreus]